MSGAHSTPKNLSVNTKIQLAISFNVVLAILIGEYIVYKILHFEGLLSILVNLLINSAIAYFFGLFVSRAITRPLYSQVKILEEMSSGRGDLTKRLTKESNDEIGDLSENFNKFVGHLLEIIQRMASGVQGMNTSIRYFNQIGQNITRNADLQRQQTKNMVKEIDMLSRNEDDIATNSQEAEKIAQASEESARLGLSVVQQTIAGMQAVSETVMQSSEKLQTLNGSFDTIGGIVVSINSIAEQTNLLALNAAIEAARAGAHGRGFAVVADEVRALATRTGQATTEINALIEKTRTNMNNLVEVLSEGTDQVTRGVEHSHHAGETLQQIVERSQEAAQRVRAITQQVSEQLNIASAVKSDVDAIAKAAQDNGDVVTQVVQFADQLTMQMDQLQEIVDEFKTAERAQERV